MPFAGQQSIAHASRCHVVQTPQASQTTRQQKDASTKQAVHEAGRPKHVSHSTYSTNAGTAFITHAHGLCKPAEPHRTGPHIHICQTIKVVGFAGMGGYDAVQKRCCTNSSSMSNGADGRTECHRYPAWQSHRRAAMGGLVRLGRCISTLPSYKCTPGGGGAAHFDFIRYVLPPPTWRWGPPHVSSPCWPPNLQACKHP